MSFNILYSGQEQTPWTFPSDPDVEEIIRQPLKTGDYTIQGLEDIICIERKAKTTEIAMNINEKRFYAELDRMNEIKHSYIIMEFEWSAISGYPYNLPKFLREKITAKRKYVHGNTLCSRLLSVSLDYNIHLITCHGATEGAKIALELMKKVYKRES